MMFFGGLGLIFMVIFWVAIIALAVWVLGRLFPQVTNASADALRLREPTRVSGWRPNRPRADDSAPASTRPLGYQTEFGTPSQPTVRRGAPSQSALEILKQRYARAEISKAEYEEMRRELEK